MKKLGRRLKTITLLIAALMIISIVSIVIYVESGSQNEESYMSSYNYDISIEANGPLDNVMLYVPLPTFENKSIVGENMISRDFYNKAPEWNFSIVETEHGNMLSITNDKIIPRYQSLPIAIEEDEDSENEVSVATESHEYSEETPVIWPVDFSIMTKVNQSIDTKDPVDNALVLLPKYKLSSSEPPYDIPTPDYIEPEYYEYESRIFAQYNSSNQTSVYIRVEVNGANEWWVGGWRSNSFQDRIIIRMNGPQDGWRTAEGSMVTGDGIYDD
ncbi:hypothetical protein [Methanolobus sp.]|uniref:hypothetical protein n=1 Tax=Methanolobus sp. TaxID=1874737 RepID=UPI0025E0574B|nr:hypothetical protein [Methanolobus sp.]